MNLFDLHCDTPTVIYEGGKPAVSFPNNIDKQVQTLAVWVRDDKPYPYEYYKTVLRCLKNAVKYPLNELSAEKSVLLAVEGGAVLEGNKDKVEELFLDGVTMLSLAWNGETALAGGVNSEKGLTANGKEAIKEFNRFNMVCDLSHLNVKSFYKAAELSDFPIASHSNSRAVCPHKRNLNDEQLKLIKDKNGLVGINFYPPFLGEGSAFSNIYNHISYMLELGLENCISIGSDLDGADMRSELDSTDKIPSLYAYLENKGLNTAILDKIFYENALNFFKNVFDKRSNML